MLIITDPRPRCLDLCCKAGGASRGYQLAGFRVTGVDHEPQPHYIGDDFVCADMFAYAEKHGREYDFIHASPPCQGYSRCTPVSYRGNHLRLIPAVRELLLLLDKPYIIENVSGARRELVNPVMLCGSMFGLPIQRHRFFELNGFWTLTPPCNHIANPVYISGTTGNSSSTYKRKEFTVAERARAIGIDWMVDKELDEAIPPAYTEYLGRRLREMGL